MTDLRKSNGWALSSCVPENSGMFSSCIVHCEGVGSFGDGGVGVFVGGGGGSLSSGSSSEYSGMSSAVDEVSKDSDVEYGE